METDNGSERAAVIAWLTTIVVDARRAADKTVRFLRAMGFADLNELPIEVYLEISAVIRLAEWERGNIKNLIDSSLPSWQDAYSDLITRMQLAGTRGEKFQAVLIHTVFFAWLTRCARESRMHFAIDIVQPSPPDLHILSEQFAHFLWRHRHLIENEES